MYHPSIRTTVSESGGQCCSPKAKRQTQRCFPSFSACTLSSSPPPSSHIWFGFFLVCFCHSLCFFLVWVYFWYSLIKSVMTAALTTVCPSVCLSQSSLHSWGFGVEDQFPKIKLPRGLLARPGGGIHTKGLPVEPPTSLLCSNVLTEGSWSRAWVGLENALVSIWELMTVLRWKMTVKYDGWSDDGNKQISVNTSRETGVGGVGVDGQGKNESRLWLNLALLTYLAFRLNSYYFKHPITTLFNTFKNNCRSYWTSFSACELSRAGSRSHRLAGNWLSLKVWSGLITKYHIKYFFFYIHTLKSACRVPTLFWIYGTW